MPASRYLIGSLPWYSVLVVAGMAVAILLASREEKRMGLPEDTAVDLALVALPLGILGARLYYVAFTWETYAADPLRILRVWEGGLAIYGGLIGGILGMVLFSRRRRIALGDLLDMAAPGVALAQSIGRWGNFFNMEAYGGVVSDPRWQFFPLAVQIPESGGIVWHQAAFFYESLWDLCVFCVLWRLRGRGRRGDTFLRYTLLYGTGRLVVEGIRTDSLYVGGAEGLRVSQLLAAAAVLACCLYLILRTLRGKRPASARSVALPAALCALPLIPAVLAWLGLLPVSAALCLAMLGAACAALAALRVSPAGRLFDMAACVLAALAAGAGLLPSVRAVPTAVCLCFSAGGLLLAAALRLLHPDRR